MSPFDSPSRTRCIATRQQRARALMTEQKLDFLLAYGPGCHSFLAMNVAWYLSGFKNLGSHALVILTRDDEPVLITTPSWDEGRARSQAMARVIAVEPADFFGAVSEQLRSRGLSGGRGALAGHEEASHRVSVQLRGLFSRGPSIFTQNLSRLARIRDAWSLECAQEAVRIAELGYEQMLALAKPGMFEHQLAANVEAHIRGLGAEDNFQLISASQHNRSVNTPSLRRIEHGDVLLGEISPAVQGEHMQICRTAVIGEASAAHRESFELLTEALKCGMRAAVPGACAADVVAEMNRPLDAAGLSRYTQPPFMRTRGHSMGLGSMVPQLGTSSRDILEEGMAFVMHPNQYMPDVGYMMCGEPVLITKTGAKPITSRLGSLGVVSR